MTVKEIVYGSGGGLLILLTLLQIAPIKINPWSAVLEWLWKPVLSKMETLERDMKTVKKEVDTIRDENREIHAKDCRVRILRFADEIYLGQPHSHEHFKQILGDITHYEKYCDAHPEFENQIAVAAIAQIKETYGERLKKHDFLA
jgi:hypothetical protein